MTDSELTALIEGFEERAEKQIRLEAGKPLVRIEIEYDWNDRGNFTRRYAGSIVTFEIWPKPRKPQQKGRVRKESTRQRQ